MAPVLRSRNGHHTAAAAIGDVSQRARDTNTVASLQSGLEGETQRAFELGLEGWFSALKWLIKEFRLHVGYETPDEEAGICFWINRFESRRDSRCELQDAMEQQFPTADEPALPASQAESSQARRWQRDMVEKRVTRFFEIRRRLCPYTPILVPLCQLQHYEAPRNCSAKLRLASLHQVRPSSREVRPTVPPTRCVDKKPSAAELDAKARTKPKTMSRETQDRLFPSSNIGGGRGHLPDEQFSSRVIDLAIEFDGDAHKASRYGHQFLSRGFLQTEDGQSSPVVPVNQRTWQEGRTPLEHLNLTQFWLQMTNHASLGLMMPLAKAERLLSERSKCVMFAQNVIHLFQSRFRYECLDASILYRFWLSMPRGVRSAHHVRGPAERQSFELLRDGVRMRAEAKRAVAQVGDAALTSGHLTSSLVVRARPPWRPNGEARPQAVTDICNDVALVNSARSVVLPFAPPRRSLENLAQPKTRPCALNFLRVLTKHFPQDAVLHRMIRQSLDIGGVLTKESGAPMFDICELIHKSEIQGKIHTTPTANSVRGQLEKDHPDTTLQLWMARHPDRAMATFNAIEAAREVSKKIGGIMRQAAVAYAKNNARVGQFGPFFSTAKQGSGQKPRLRGLEMVEDLFARLCRNPHIGTWEMVARFGADYLPMRRGTMPGGFLAPAFPAVLGRGGPTVDCSTRRAVCSADSEDAGCCADAAVDGELDTGWRPESFAAETGGASWTADLGRQQSCVGVILRWVLPKRKDICYVNRLQLAADLTLELGRDGRILVRSVREGGVAATGGVVVGDVLQLGAGGDGDVEFASMPPSEALLSLQQDASSLSIPVRFVFQGLSSYTPFPQQVTVKVLAARCSQGSDEEPEESVFEEIVEKTSPASPGAVDVPGIFVGRWVRLHFMGPWPKTKDGQVYKLSVSVMKVWRLAPPSFRRQLIEFLTKQLMKKRARGSTDCTPAHLEGKFWAYAANSGTHNSKVLAEIKLRKQNLHDVDDSEEELFEEIGEFTRHRQPVPGKPPTQEFNIEVTKEVKAWRPKLYEKLEDVRECTFHPRTAGNVHPRVHRVRERIGETFPRQDEARSVKEFVKDLGEDFESRTYPNYHIVSRRRAFARARLSFLQGFHVAALAKLQKSFGVTSILKRFVCYHEGCSTKLDQSSEICACAGFYCLVHADGRVHNCKRMKQKLSDQADAQRKKDKALREEGECPEPEEQWNDKVEVGLLLQVKELAEAIMDAKAKKTKQRRSLENLEQSLSHFGAVRLAERPFRRRMCGSAVTTNRSWTQDGGVGVPLFSHSVSSANGCECPNAHRPSELRFKGGESAERRLTWVREALAEVNHRQEVLPDSAAERKKEPRARAKSQPKKRSEGPTQRRPTTRALSEARLKSLEEGSRDLQKAVHLLTQAKGKLRGGNNEEARQSVGMIRGMVSRRVKEAASVVSHAGRESRALEPEAEAQPLFSSKSAHLRSKIRLLAGKEERIRGVDPAARISEGPVVSSWNRPLRECERQELLSRGAENVCDARRVLGECADLEAEVRSSEEATSQFVAFSAGLDDSPKLRMAPGIGGRSQMCAEYLDAGVCMRGNACPFAHRPGDLSRRSGLEFEEP